MCYALLLGSAYFTAGTKYGGMPGRKDGRHCCATGPWMSSVTPGSIAASHRKDKWAASADETRAEGEYRSPPQSPIGKTNGPRALTKRELRANPEVHCRVP